MPNGLRVQISKISAGALRELSLKYDGHADHPLLRRSHRDAGFMVLLAPDVFTLLDDGLAPVVSTIGSDDSGQPYNINADEAAMAIAVAMEAEKIIYLTAAPGLLEDPRDEESLVPRLSSAELRERVQVRFSRPPSQPTGSFGRVLRSHPRPHPGRLRPAGLRAVRRRAVDGRAPGLHHRPPVRLLGVARGDLPDLALEPEQRGGEGQARAGAGHEERREGHNRQQCSDHRIVSAEEAREPHEGEGEAPRHDQHQETDREQPHILRNGSRHTIPFEFAIPWEAPLTHMYGRPLLGTTVAAVNSALQRARKAVATLHPWIQTSAGAEELIAAAHAAVLARASARREATGLGVAVSRRHEVGFSSSCNRASTTSRSSLTGMSGFAMVSAAGFSTTPISS